VEDFLEGLLQDPDVEPIPEEADQNADTVLFNGESNDNRENMIAAASGNHPPGNGSSSKVLDDTEASLADEVMY